MLHGACSAGYSWSSTNIHICIAHVSRNKISLPSRVIVAVETDSCKDQNQRQLGNDRPPGGDNDHRDDDIEAPTELTGMQRIRVRYQHSRTGVASRLDAAFPAGGSIGQTLIAVVKPRAATHACSSPRRPW